MGLLVEGKWFDHWYDTKSTGGHFVRKDSAFRNFIGSERFPAASDRYHLYISHACPWAHRTAIFRQLKGLQALISLSVVEAFMGEHGWVLGEGSDPVNNKSYLHEVYTLAEPKYSGRVTVPVLWDKQQRTIVSNESSEIIRMFNSAFDHLTGNQLDLYPEPLRAEIDSINAFVYDSINNGVYKAGFATDQEVYAAEVSTLFEALEDLEARLARQRYLVGGQLTEADIRLFTTLVRFDPVYVGHFKCNIKRIADYPNLSNYVRDIYQTQNIAQTVRLDHIKEHYYVSHTTINPTQIVPVGPAIDYLAAHDRDRF